MNDRDPLLKAIDAIRAKPGLVPEADALLKLAAESAQGRPLAEIVADLESDLSRFITFMRLCFDNRELKTQFDRLRGTNVSRSGSPMNESSADTAGVAPRHATDGIPPLSAALCYPLAESTQNTRP